MIVTAIFVICVLGAVYAALSGTERSRYTMEDVDAMDELTTRSLHKLFPEKDKAS